MSKDIQVAIVISYQSSRNQSVSFFNIFWKHFNIWNKKFQLLNSIILIVWGICLPWLSNCQRPGPLTVFQEWFQEWQVWLTPGISESRYLAGPRKFRSEMRNCKKITMEHQVEIVRPFSANRWQQYNIQRFIYAYSRCFFWGGGGSLGWMPRSPMKSWQSFNCWAVSRYDPYDNANSESL
jgi:hypothetical protein